MKQNKTRLSSDEQLQKDKQSGRCSQKRDQFIHFSISNISIYNDASIGIVGVRFVRDDELSVIVRLANANHDQPANTRMPLRETERRVSAATGSAARWIQWSVFFILPFEIVSCAFCYSHFFNHDPIDAYDFCCWQQQKNITVNRSRRVSLFCREASSRLFTAWKVPLRTSRRMRPSSCTKRLKILPTTSKTWDETASSISCRRSTLSTWWTRWTTTNIWTTMTTTTTLILMTSPSNRTIQMPRRNGGSDGSARERNSWRPRKSGKKRKLKWWNGSDRTESHSWPRRRLPKPDGIECVSRPTGIR